MDKKQIAALDFDSSLAHYKNGWTGVIPTEGPVDGAVDFCNWLVKMGYDIVIFSCRATNVGGPKAIYDWLESNGFPMKNIVRITDTKPHAAFYLDDKAIRFNGSFDEVKSYIKSNPTLKRWDKV